MRCTFFGAHVALVSSFTGSSKGRFLFFLKFRHMLTLSCLGGKVPTKGFWGQGLFLGTSPLHMTKPQTPLLRDHKNRLCDRTDTLESNPVTSWPWVGSQTAFQPISWLRLAWYALLKLHPECHAEEGEGPCQPHGPFEDVFRARYR